MKYRSFLFALLLAVALPAKFAHAQAAPTATRGLQLSAFGGVSGGYLGFANGRNAAIVAGADLDFSVWHGIRPAIEVRGLYPIDSGSIAGQRSILFGPRVAFLQGRRFHPYGDFLFGRGEMDYLHGGYIFNGLQYIESTTNVYSPGFGLDYDLTPHFSIKIDGQAQRWSYAPTPSGNVWSKVGTVGVVYHFTFGPRRLP
jgi:hypothetical protein